MPLPHSPFKKTISNIFKEMLLEIGFIEMRTILEVIKRYPEPRFTISLIRENRIKLLDFAPSATLRFKILGHQKRTSL